MNRRGVRGVVSAAIACLLSMGSICAQTTTPSITSLALGDGSSMTTPQGPIGMGFIIQGMHFGATQGSSTVKLGSSSLTVISWSDTSITVQVPTGATTGNVVVTVSGTASNAVSFTVSNPFGCS